MKINYQLLLEKEIEKSAGLKRLPKLLLHACCAPCASYVTEYLTSHFDITLYFCNPNITDEAEYKKRADELLRFAGLLPHENPINVIICPMNTDGFYSISKGLETLPEGGVRCFECYRLRLEETAKYMAGEGGYDYFATTLTVSPHKNADKLNEIGYELAEKYGVAYLPSDFKKREGYKRSIELSREYGLYRQNFCGCEFSKMAALGRE